MQNNFYINDLKYKYNNKMEKKTIINGLIDN